MDIALYIKKIDHYINEIKNIDLIYVQKIITRLYSLKQLLKLVYDDLDLLSKVTSLIQAVKSNGKATD